MQQYLQNKEGLVENVFNKVFDKYDLMNDFMSFGIHRIWKKNLLTWMNPSSNKILADVACGTGDIAKLFLDETNTKSKIQCVDPNNIGFYHKGRVGIDYYNQQITARREKYALPFADADLLSKTYCDMSWNSS